MKKRTLYLVVLLCGLFLTGCLRYKKKCAAYDKVDVEQVLNQE